VVSTTYPSSLVIHTRRNTSARTPASPAPPLPVPVTVDAQTAP
jgi:hypothetical protein